MATPNREATKQDFELQMGVNHFAHALLIELLVPTLMKKAPDARVVILSSSAHGFGGERFIHNERFETDPYNPWKAYGNAKLANALFAQEFNKRHAKQGLLCVSAHPGVILTNLGRYMATGVAKYTIAPLFALVMMFVGKSVSQGAATSVYCATSPEVSELGGQYFRNAHVQSLEAKQRRIADNEELCNEFFDRTLKLIAPFRK